MRADQRIRLAIKALISRAFSRFSRRDFPDACAADELRAIAETLQASPEDIKLGDEASVTTVKREPLDDYRVVYFATHALVAGEVEQFAKLKGEPSLVLSIPDKPTEDDDGLLTALSALAVG